ncbi:MAG: prolipoprotein diacylglyceryl transferase [Planctomycetes bacterium]|nr:prolipoprotein diacylglyceryl transferase [Planctomycetota bacterium]
MMPVLFHLPGGIPIYSYGVALGLSCVLGAHLAVYLATRSGIEEKRAWWFAITVIVVGIVGGRVHDVAVNARSVGEFMAKITEVQHAGRTAYGAFLSASIAAVFASRAYRVPFWRFADAVAPTMALGLGLTRVGCFLWGCDYGVHTEAWGVRFPAGSPPWQDQIEAGLLTTAAPTSLPVFPIQLVESAAGFAIGVGLLWLWFRRPRREGTVFLWFFASYGLVRALLEVWRADEGRGELAGMSTSMAIGLFTAGPALLLLLAPPLARLRGDSGEVLPAPTDEEDEKAPKKKKRA